MTIYQKILLIIFINIISILSGVTASIEVLSAPQAKSQSFPETATASSKVFSTRKRLFTTFPPSTILPLLRISARVPASMPLSKSLKNFPRIRTLSGVYPRALRVLTN